MAIEWITTLDVNDFKKGMNEMREQVRETKVAIEVMGGDAQTALENLVKTGQGVVGTFKGIAATAGVAFGVSQIKSFLQKASETRAYFQDIESSMKVFLGSEEKALEFTKKLKDYAYYNMFEFSELAQASKQMIAYGHSVDDVIPRIDQLSNVARGTSAPLMEMVRAYNIAKNIGYLDSRALQSWASKGLVVNDVLKEMGEKVKDNRVTFAQLNKVLDHVTGEGGMFHNLMGAQMNNISAEKGQLEDTLTAMYEAVGRKFQDVITKGYRMASDAAEGFTDSADGILDAGAKMADFMLDHYKQIGEAILALIAAHGTYRATIIATEAIKNVQRNVAATEEIRLLDEEIAKYRELLPEKEKAKNADLEEAVVKGKLTQEQANLIAAKRVELENSMIEKETLQTNKDIIKAKTQLLDIDLQERVANNDLSLSQAETIQKRREELEVIEQQVQKRKEAMNASVENDLNKNESAYNRTYTTLENSEKTKADNDKQIKGIDKRIEKLKDVEGYETKVAELEEKKGRIQEENVRLDETIEAGRQRLLKLEEERTGLLSKQREIYMFYGNEEEQLDALREQKSYLQEQLNLVEQNIQQNKASLDIARENHEEKKKYVDTLNEQLEKEQEINRERSEEGDVPNDLSSLQETVDIAAIEEATAAQEVQALTTEEQTLATKKKDIQQQIDNLQNKESAITTQADTQAKMGNTAATTTNSVAQKAHALALKASSTATKIFSTAVNQAKNAIKAMGVAIMTNPLGLIIGALTMALPYIMGWFDGLSETKDAQEALNDSIEEHNKLLKEEQESQRNDIRTLQDKNATLYDQYEAYKRLTKAESVFSKYTPEELKNMSKEQIDALFSEDEANKQHKFLEDQVAAYKEFRQWIADNNKNAGAWAVSGEEDELKRLQEKYPTLGDALVTAWRDHSASDNNLQYADEMIASATKSLQERLEGEAQAGVVVGLSKGFGSSEVQAQAQNAIKGFSDAMSKLPADATEEEAENIAQKYKAQISPALKEATDKAEELNHQLIGATGEKKAKITAELASANKTKEFLESIMSYFGAGVTNRQLVVDIISNSDSALLSEDAKKDIADGYTQLESLSDKYLTKLTEAQDEVHRLGVSSEEGAESIAAKFGLTADSVSKDFGEMEKGLESDIEEMKKKYADMADGVEKNKLKVEIEKKEELLHYIQDVKTRLLSIAEKPYNLVVNIVGNVADNVKAFLGGILGKNTGTTSTGTSAAGGVSIGGAIGGAIINNAIGGAKAAVVKPVEDSANKDKEENQELTDKERRAAEKAAQDAANRRKKLAEIDRKEQEEEEAQSKRTREAIERARIARIQNTGEREREEQEEQYRLDLQKVTELEDSYRKKNLDLIKSRWEANNKNKSITWEDTAEAKAGADAVKLTEDQQKEVDAVRVEAEAKHNKIVLERYRNEAQAMRDYLKEYGSYEQQRLAITEEYEEKIREAKTEGEKLRLQEEYKQAQSNLNLTNIMGGIDWRAVFGGVENMTTDMMKVLSEQLRAWQQSPEYESSDAATKQQVAQILADMRQYIGSDMSVTWETLATDIDNFNNAVTAFNEAREAEKPFVEAYEEARRKEQEATDTLNKMISEGASEEDVNEQQGIVDSLKQETQAAADNMKPFSAAVADSRKKVETFGKQVNTTTDELKNRVPKWLASLNSNEAWKDVEGYSQTKENLGQLNQIGSDLEGLSKQLGDGIGSQIAGTLGSGLQSMAGGIGGMMSNMLGGVLGQMVGFVAQIPKLILSLADSIKDMVTGVLNSFTELLRFDWLTDFVDEILDAFTNLIDAVLDLPETIVKAIGHILESVVSAVGNIIGRITDVFGIKGGPAEWLGFTENFDDVIAEIDDLTESNEKLQNTIDRLSDIMEDSTVWQAQETFELQMKAFDQIAKNTAKQIDDAFGASSSGHSSGMTRVRGYLTPEDRKAIDDFLGYEWSGKWSELYGDPQTWRRFAKELPAIYDMIIDKAADVSRIDPSEYMQKQYDLAVQYDELVETYKEKLTNVSFDSIRSDFFNVLMDMDSDAEDFASNFEKYMQQAIINSMVSNVFEERLKTWQAAFASFAQSGNELTVEEVKMLRETGGWYDDLATGERKQFEAMNDMENEALEMRNYLRDVFQWGDEDSYKQEASSRGFQAMSQDTGEELNGRFTALQIAGESINAQMMVAVTHLEQITALHVGTNTYLSEMRELAVSRNSYLEDIAKYSKQMYLDFSEKMDDLVTNTKNL